jgi:FlaA1/EpsC-like NDP-sugar epimerase
MTKNSSFFKVQNIFMKTSLIICYWCLWWTILLFLDISSCQIFFVHLLYIIQKNTLVTRIMKEYNESCQSSEERKKMKSMLSHFKKFISVFAISIFSFGNILIQKTYNSCIVIEHWLHTSVVVSRSHGSWIYLCNQCLPPL